MRAKAHSVVIDVSISHPLKYSYLWIGDYVLWTVTALVGYSSLKCFATASRSSAPIVTPARPVISCEMVTNTKHWTIETLRVTNHRCISRAIKKGGGGVKTLFNSLGLSLTLDRILTI